MEEKKEERKEKGVNRWAYVLLAFFVGLLGLHRFYAGHCIAGLCYLITFALGSLLSFIGVGVILLCIEGVFCLYDVIRGLMAKEDEKGLIYV